MAAGLLGPFPLGHVAGDSSLLSELPIERNYRDRGTERSSRMWRISVLELAIRTIFLPTKVDIFIYTVKVAISGVYLAYHARYWHTVNFGSLILEQLELLIMYIF